MWWEGREGRRKIGLAGGGNRTEVEVVTRLHMVAVGG